MFFKKLFIWQMKGNIKLGSKSLHSMKLNKYLFYNIKDNLLTVSYTTVNKIVRFALGEKNI